MEVSPLWSWIRYRKSLWIIKKRCLFSSVTVSPQNWVSLFSSEFPGARGGENKYLCGHNNRNCTQPVLKPEEPWVSLKTLCIQCLHLLMALGIYDQSAGSKCSQANVLPFMAASSPRSQVDPQMASGSQEMGSVALTIDLCSVLLQLSWCKVHGFLLFLFFSTARRTSPFCHYHHRPTGSTARLLPMFT